MRRASGSYDCINVDTSTEFASELAATAKRRPAPAPGASHTALLSEAVARLDRKQSRARLPVLVVSHGERGQDFRLAARQLLGERALWMDDYVQPWYRTDVDTPSAYLTHARSYVELHVCARARRVVGNFAAPSTRAICQLKSGTAAGSGNALRAGECIDTNGEAPPRDMY